MAIIIAGLGEDGEFERATPLGGELGERRTAKGTCDSTRIAAQAIAELRRRAAAERRGISVVNWFIAGRFDR
jgi:hypothetical protein